MDDWKFIQKDRKAKGIFIDTLRDEYESVFEDGSGKMKVIKVKVHQYLGVNLDYILKGQVRITILYYIK